MSTTSAPITKKPTKKKVEEGGIIGLVNAFIEDDDDEDEKKEKVTTEAEKEENEVGSHSHKESSERICYNDPKHA